MSIQNSPRPSTLSLRRFLTLLTVAGFLFLAIPASGASAAPGDFAPTPAVPDVGPVIVGPVLGSLKAEVVADCAAGTPVAVNISNTTQSFTLVETRVDGVLVDSQSVGPQMAGFVDLGFVENQTSNVKVSAGSSVLFEGDVTLDCLLPSPSYVITEDCETAQAFAVLKNTGDDTAHMGVRYEGAPYMLEEVPPHDSVMWLLAVDPGETVDFDVMVGSDVLGSEHVVFECTPPVTSPPATVPPTTAPPVTVPPTTVPPVTVTPATVPAVPDADGTAVETAGEATAGSVDTVGTADPAENGGADGLNPDARGIDDGDIAAGEALLGAPSSSGSSRLGLWVGGSLILGGLGLIGLLAWAWVQRRRIHAR